MDETRTRLTKCFLAVFPELSLEQAVTATPASVKCWDSIASLNLLTVIEEEFGVEIDLAELLEALSYEQIAGYIQKRMEPHDSEGQRQAKPADSLSCVDSEPHLPRS